MVEQALRRKPLVADQHLGLIGAAYYLAGRPEEAIAPLKQYLTRYPNNLGAHLYLAAVYSELGRAAEARAEAGPKCCGSILSSPSKFTGGESRLKTQRC